jgi:hypothetical protein
MRVNPFWDVFAFLMGPSYGEPAFMAILYWIVALTSLAVAVAVARILPDQISGVHIGRFVVRFILGSALTVLIHRTEAIDGL